MSEKKKIVKLGSKIMKFLDLPEEVLDGTLKITMFNNEHLLVENHVGIYEFFEHSVRILGNDGTVNIKGNALVLLEVSKERLYITGSIKGIDVE